MDNRTVIYKNKIKVSLLFLGLIKRGNCMMIRKKRINQEQLYFRMMKWNL